MHDFQRFKPASTVNLVILSCKCDKTKEITLRKCTQERKIQTKMHTGAQNHTKKRALTKVQTQGGIHRVNEAGEAVQKSHHTQPNCRGRKNLNSRRNERGNGRDNAKYRYSVTH